MIRILPRTVGRLYFVLLMIVFASCGSQYFAAKRTNPAGGCGTNSMKVFVSWYYEDNDRDDGDGPGQEILPQ